MHKQKKSGFSKILGLIFILIVTFLMTCKQVAIGDLVSGNVGIWGDSVYGAKAFGP